MPNKVNEDYSRLMKTVKSIIDEAVANYERDNYIPEEFYIQPKVIQGFTDWLNSKIVQEYVRKGWLK